MGILNQIRVQGKITLNTIIDAISPSAPTNLLVSNIQGNQVDLTWTASTDNVGISHYVIYNNDVEIATTSNNNINYTLTGLTSATTYNLTVRGVDASNNESTNSNLQSFDTLDNISPNAPTNLASSNITQTTIDLDWDAATDNVAVVNYRIFNNDIEIHSLGNTNTSYTLTGLTPATEYNLTVKAYDNAGNFSSASNIETVTTASSSIIHPYYRVNAGGESIPSADAYTNWEANDAQANQTGTFYTVNVGSIFNNSLGMTPHASIPNYIDTATFNAIFSQERVDTVSATDVMEFIFYPVPNGDYIMNVYAGNYYDGTDQIGERLFDIEIEGVVVESDVDLVAKFGHRVGGMLSYPITVTDGSINVKFLHGTENPLVNALELVSSVERTIDAEAPTAPTTFAVTNVTATTADLSWTASTDNIGVTNYRIYNNDVLLEDLIGNVTSYNLTGLSSGVTYNLTIRAIDAEENESTNSNTEQFTTTAGFTVTSQTEVDDFETLNGALTSGQRYAHDYLVSYLKYEGIWNKLNDISTQVNTNYYKLKNSVAKNNIQSGDTGVNLNVYSFNDISVVLDYNTVPSGDTELLNDSGSELRFAYYLGGDPYKAIHVGNNIAGLSHRLTFNNKRALVINSNSSDLSLCDKSGYVTKDPNSGNTGTFSSATLTLDDSADLNFFAVGEGLSINEANLLAQGITTFNELMGRTEYDDEVPNYEFVGDSITWGYEPPGNKILSNYPKLVGDALGNTNSNANTANLGVSGIELESVYVEIQNYDKYGLLTRNPNVQTTVCVALGTNDFLKAPVKTASEVKFMLDTYTSILSNAGNRVIVILPHRTTSYSQDNPANYNSQVPTLISLVEADANYSNGINATDTIVFETGNATEDDVNNSTYWYDGLHPKAAYFTAFEPILTAVIQNTSTTDNLQFEDDVANATVVPYADRANLQTYIDNNNAVRLEIGDYDQASGGASSITLSGNKKLFGSNLNKVPTINVAPGSNGVVVDGVRIWSGLNLLSGSPITNCRFSHLQGGNINSTGGFIENNEFIDIIGAPININCSSSGYFRNNQLVKHWITSNYPQLNLQGNNTTPSYGNTWAWLNLLTAHGNPTDINNFDNINILGLDAEAWNYEAQGNRALLYMRDVGDVKISSLAGNGYRPQSTAVFDIVADSLYLLDKKISSNNFGGGSTVTAETFTINSNSDSYGITGNDSRGHFNNTQFTYNGSNRTSLITGGDATSISNAILGSQKTPWARAVFPTLADPNGATWATDRIGQTDSYAYIQNLINTNGYAELDEGTYYISQPLLIHRNQGIIGKGTGKTSIVGLTDNFNLINVRGAGLGAFTVKYLTLQGGDKGIHITSDGFDVWFQPNGIDVKYLVFRNQTTYGIEVAQMYGMDNNMFEQCHFIGLPTGFKQTPDPNYTSGETNHMTYIDKTVFYKCQFINCGTAMSMLTGRADNLNAWIECNFDGNGVAAILNNHNAPVFINCDFKNHTGSYVVSAYTSAGIYSCDFTGNSTTNILHGSNITIEGCNFNDNIPLFGTSVAGFIANSTVVGSVGNLNNGMVINSNMQSDSNLNNLLVNVVGGTPTILLNNTPDPYPQFLVKQ